MIALFKKYDYVISNELLDAQMTQFPSTLFYDPKKFVLGNVET